MKITVIAHPKSRQEKVIRHDERYYDIYFNVPPEKGKANEKIKEMLADFLGVSKPEVEIKKGLTGPIKIVEIG